MIIRQKSILNDKIMRKHIVAGNWKMNTTVAEGVELAKAVVEASAEVPADVKLIIAVPFTTSATG